MINEYEDKYKELISQFIGKLSNKDLSGIPCPMIPCVGEMYEKTTCKIAFFGMETNGWGDLQSLRQLDSKEILENLTKDFKDLNFLGWTNNFHTSYWDYVLEFLRKLYKIRNSDEMQYGKYQNILRSFIWGNTNALERYEVTAKKNAVDKKVWEEVKEASLIFDSAKYILEICKPHILIITNWSQDESWLIGNEKIAHTVLDNHIWYYLTKTDTHVYWLPHPRWIYINKKLDSSIEIILKHLKSRNINFDSIFDKKEELKPEELNIDNREYIGELATFLFSKNKTMSGMELANHLNRNGMKTSYGSDYVGGRGTYTLIRSSYHYFNNKKKQDIAKAIASVFVKENGDFAYK